MRQNYFFEYVPNAYINLCVDKAKQMANNRFVYDFKAGDKVAVQICAEWLVRYLTKQYSSILEDFVVVLLHAAHNGNITSDSAISQPSLMQQVSRPQTSTFTSSESASQPTTEAATLLTRTFITFQ